MAQGGPLIPQGFGFFFPKEGAFAPSLPVAETLGLLPVLTANPR